MELHATVILLMVLIHDLHGQETRNADSDFGDRSKPEGSRENPWGPEATEVPSPSGSTRPPLPTLYPPGIEISCPMRYKCEERFGLPLNYHDKNCYCDTVCETYGDCCKDYVAPTGRRAKKTKLPRNTFTCQRVEEIDRNVEIYVVEGCPRDFTDTEIRAKCEGAINSDDAFQRVPVVSKETKVLYKNFYCAQCGGEFNVSFWKVLLNCEHIAEPPSNISLKGMVEGAVRFAEQNRQFCGTLFDAPSSDLKARTCKSNIGRCDRSFSDKRMAKKCRGHTSYVYVGLEVFKNKFCAQCNYVNESYLSCEDTRTPRIVFEEAPLITSPFSILLDLNTGAGSISEHRVGANGQIEVSEVASMVQPCPENHIYDHFRRQCRMLVCTGTHHLVGADCVPINPESQPTTTPPEITGGGDDTESPGLGEDNQNLPLEPDFEWPDRPNKNPNSEEDDFSLEIPDTYNDDNDDPYPHYNINDPDFDPDRIIPYDPDRMDIDPYWDPNSTPDLQLDCLSFMKLNETEYRLFENHSIYVFALNQMFHAPQIEHHGRFAYVCSPYKDSGPQVNGNSNNNNNGINNNESTAHVNATVIMFTFTYLQSFISFVGLLVSMMALLIMFIMYCAYKQLRTVAGMSAMSLAFALFIAQGLFLFGMPRTDHHNVCLSLGALMHYFFLAAFFWLNVMSFDIYRTFSNSYDASASSGCGGRFACYFLYAWTTPACIVGVALSLDFFQYAEDIYQPHYAEHICWIVRRYALLFLFALPLAILLAINIIIYIISLLKSITSNKEKGRGRLLLYIQLSFVMGLTWIFAFIATLTDMWVFWYVFITFNSFQGIFICFAFVCNRKVFRIIKSKGKVQQQNQQQRKDVRFSNGHHRTFSSARHTFLTDGEARIIAQETSI